MISHYISSILRILTFSETSHVTLFIELFCFAVLDLLQKLRRANSQIA
jgi:hypothetical protein